MTTTRRRFRARFPLLPAITLALALLLAVVVVSRAQVAPAPAVTVSVDATALEMPAGNASTLQATVRNTGDVAGAVRVAVRAPEGWDAGVTPDAFDLEAGAARTITVTLRAPPADAADGAGGGAGVTATLTDALGRTADAEAAFTVSVAAAAPVIPGGRGGVLLAGGALLAGAALLGGGVAVQRRRRRRLAVRAREEGVRIDVPDGPHAVGSGREVAVRVRVRNESPRERLVVVTISDAPDGWAVGLSRSTLRLAVGEEALVTLTASPGPRVPDGAAGTLVVAAQPEDADTVHARVNVEVTARAPGVPLEGRPGRIRP